MELILPLSGNKGESKHRQVADALKKAILAGRLTKGQKLPSVRALAIAMALSPETISIAYKHLANEGIIRTVPGGGTYVDACPLLADIDHAGENVQPQSAEDMARLPESVLSDYGRRLIADDFNYPLFLRSMNYEAAPTDLLPIARWRDLLSRACRYDDNRLFAFQTDPFGYMPLREAVADYLWRARSLTCSPEQIIFFASPEAGIDMVARLLLNSGDLAAVENPGLPIVRRIFQSQGIKILPIPVDENGMIVERLLDSEIKPKLVFVTPASHEPSGAALSKENRLSLLMWARQNQSYILENDFDSEYRYGEQPAPALQSLDEDNNHVIFRYNFWRVLFPLVRTGFLVVPPKLVRVFRQAKFAQDSHSPVIEQRALADLIAEGTFEFHIKRTRAFYAERRAALIQALTKYFFNQIKISNVSAGMHILIDLPFALSEDRVLDWAKESGLPMAPTRTYYVDGFAPGEYIVGFAWGEPEELRNAVEAFARRILQNTAA